MFETIIFSKPTIYIMSFIKFLKQVAKMGFGYGGGFILMIAAVGVFTQGQTTVGGILGLISIILLLFGVYSEREL